MSNSTLLSAAPTKIRSFTDLEAWKEGHKLVIAIYRTTESFPDSEKFGLTNQMRRSAVSIISNIAEGFRRNSAKDKRQFYSTSIASLSELQNQLLISRDIEYMKHEIFDELASQSVKVSRLITGLIKSAQSRS